MRLSLFIFTLCVAFTAVYAESLPDETISTNSTNTVNATATDSLGAENTIAAENLSLSNTYEYNKKVKIWRSTAGFALIGAGAIALPLDHHFRSLRNDYMPRFHNVLDDYTQYLPAAVMLGMKLGGVKGRSSWLRMLVSDAFSVAAMTLATNGIKYTVKERRPEGTARNSFPSGHTATAFMTASMLAHEYGHISPWISCAAYTVAAGTGIMRIANNRHWAGDVLAGAGIGVLSTELGYWVTDLIFKDKGITRHPIKKETFDRYARPSFLSLNVGIMNPLHRIHTAEGQVLAADLGAFSNIEGAYFFSPYWGVGGSVGIGNIRFDNQGADNEGSIGTTALLVGPYFSYPFTSRIALSASLKAGLGHHPDLAITETSTLPQSNNPLASASLNVTVRCRKNLSFRTGAEYQQILHSAHLAKEISLLNIFAGAAFNF